LAPAGGRSEPQVSTVRDFGLWPCFLFKENAPRQIIRSALRLRFEARYFIHSLRWHPERETSRLSRNPIGPLDLSFYLLSVSLNDYLVYDDKSEARILEAFSRKGKIRKRGDTRNTFCSLNKKEKCLRPMAVASSGSRRDGSRKMLLRKYGLDDRIYKGSWKDFSCLAPFD